MDDSMVWVISPDPDTRRLIGLNLSKRGFRILEASPQDELAPPAAKPHLICAGCPGCRGYTGLLAAGPAHAQTWARPGGQGVGNVEAVRVS